VNLASVDLNLLEPLIALLEERSVTRSAIRTQRSQPAVSASLARLRRIFDDELLRRVGNHYELTPFAEQLLPACLEALASVHRVFGSGAAFDPSASRRTYRIAISDYASALIGPHIAEMINAAAPRAGVEFTPILRTLVELAPESLRPYDGLILPHGFLTELPHLDLFNDRWVCLTAAGNPAVTDELTLRHLAELPWVLSYGAHALLVHPVRQLHMLGLKPRIEVTLDGFMALPSFVVGTNRVCIVQERLVALLAHADALRAWPCPFDATPLCESLWWHPTREADPEHIWLRSVISTAGGRV
jgi:DNA-binding transcriptional LysR family regulator